MFKIETLRYMRDCLKYPNESPELYNLTDLLIGDLECAREVAQGIMKAQLNIKSQKYLTSSMVIPVIEKLRESLRSTRVHYTTRRGSLEHTKIYIHKHIHTRTHTRTHTNKHD